MLCLQQETLEMLEEHLYTLLVNLCLLEEERNQLQEQLCTLQVKFSCFENSWAS
jgi:predicted nuclease with TOPRIM domain